MRLISLILVAIAVVYLQGCAVAVVGGGAAGAYAYDQKGKRDSRQKYFEEFNKTNIEREKNGLQPLEICAYKRSIDKDWAAEDSSCKI
jgi:hypothetical protein